MAYNNLAHYDMKSPFRLMHDALNYKVQEEQQCGTKALTEVVFRNIKNGISNKRQSTTL